MMDLEMSMERKMPMVGTLWVVLPRSVAVFDCASRPAVSMGWSGWDMRAQKHPGHKQDCPQAVQGSPGAGHRLWPLCTGS